MKMKLGVLVAVTFTSLVGAQAAQADCTAAYRKASKDMQKELDTDQAFEKAGKYYRSDTAFIAKDLTLLFGTHVAVDAAGGAGIVGGLGAAVGTVAGGPIGTAAGAGGGAIAGALIGAGVGVLTAGSLVENIVDVAVAKDQPITPNPQVAATQDEITKERKEFRAYLEDIKRGEDLIREVTKQGGQGTVLDSQFEGVSADQRERVVDIIREANSANEFCTMEGSVLEGSAIRKYVLAKMKSNEEQASDRRNKNYGGESGRSVVAMDFRQERAPTTLNTEEVLAGLAEKMRE